MNIADVITTPCMYQGPEDKPRPCITGKLLTALDMRFYSVTCQHQGVCNTQKKRHKNLHHLATIGHQGVCIHRRGTIQSQSSLAQVEHTLGMHNSQTLVVGSASSHLGAATPTSRVQPGMMPTGALPVDTPNPTPLNGSPRYLPLRYMMAAVYS